MKISGSQTLLYHTVMYGNGHYCVAGEANPHSNISFVPPVSVLGLFRTGEWIDNGNISGVGSLYRDHHLVSLPTVFSGNFYWVGGCSLEPDHFLPYNGNGFMCFYWHNNDTWEGMGSLALIIFAEMVHVQVLC